MTKVLLEDPVETGAKFRAVELEKVAEPKIVPLLVLALGVDGCGLAIANAIFRPPRAEETAE